MRTLAVLMRWLVPALLLVGSICVIEAAQAPSNAQPSARSGIASSAGPAILTRDHGDLARGGQGAPIPAATVRALAHPAVECADPLAVLASVTTLDTGIAPTALWYALAALVPAMIGVSWWRATPSIGRGARRWPLFGLIQVDACVLLI